MEAHRIYIRWFKWSLLSLVIVALYGVLMRYKIAFSFPFLDQKNLLHAHSHFAFSAWISHTLYCGLVVILTPRIATTKRGIYNWLIWLNLLAAFGMLIAFTLQGYKAFSIFFSTMTIVFAVVFCIRFFKDSKTITGELSALHWAKAGLLLNVISSLGPFALAYMMISKNVNSDFYLSSIYYFLHFQYNGWFFFSMMALAVHLIPSGILKVNNYLKAFAITIIPTYGLSILWVKPPLWLYVIIVAATWIQLAAWMHFLIKIFKSRQLLSSSKPSAYARFFLYSAIIALSIKFLLQSISIIPSLSQLVFGFRPIVIAYLHLVLLGVYSFFILFYAIKKEWITMNRLSKWALMIFFSGVLLNETFLGIQGIASFAYIPIPYINELLLVAALALLSGALILLTSQLKKQTW